MSRQYSSFKQPTLRDYEHVLRFKAAATTLMEEHRQKRSVFNNRITFAV
jgi:hypothetical protein